MLVDFRKQAHDATTIKAESVEYVKSFKLLETKNCETVC